MSTTIEKVTIGTEEGRIVLKNSQIARTLSIGSSWTHLRLGIRAAITDWGQSSINSSNFLFGIMATPPGNDLAYGPMGNQCPHFYGVFPGAGVTFTRSTVTVDNYQIPSMRTIKIVSGARTVTGSPGTNLYFPVIAASRRVCAILDIIRSGGDLTAAICATNILAPATWSTDIPASILVDAMNGTASIINVRDILNAHAGGSGYIGISASGAIAIDEGTNGALTTVVLAHSSHVCPLHVSDFYWRKVV